MNDRMKQRAVGAVVILSLAIIFIPMALDFSRDRGQENADLTLPTPPGGEFKTVTIPMKEWSDKTVDDVAPQRALTAEADDLMLDAEPVVPPVPIAVDPQPVVAEVAPPEVTPEPKSENKVASAPAEAPKVEKKIVPNPQLAVPTAGARVWAVQVGSFSQHKNAKALSDKLRKMGYPAFTLESKASGKTIVRVRVGPELARSEADRIKAEIERRLKLQAMVIPYK